MLVKRYKIQPNIFVSRFLGQNKPPFSNNRVYFRKIILEDLLHFQYVFKEYSKMIIFENHQK